MSDLTNYLEKSDIEDEIKEQISKEFEEEGNSTVSELEENDKIGKTDNIGENDSQNEDEQDLELRDSEELVIVENNSERETHKSPKEKKSEAKVSFIPVLILIGIIIIVFSIGLFLIINTIGNGAANALTEFDSAKQDAIDKIEQSYYDYFYNRGKEQYHVTGDVVLKVEGIQEISRLEVLSVSDVSYYISDEEHIKNSFGATIWLKYYGYGVYTVDLQLADFVLDPEHNYILVRVPSPELTNFTLSDEAKIFSVDKNKNFIPWEKNQSSEVSNFLLNARKDANGELEEKMSQNQDNLNEAKEHAKESIKRIIRDINADNTELIVDVEFF